MQFYEALIDLTAEATVTLDGADRIVSLNSMARRLFGYVTDDMFGQSLGALIAPGDRNFSLDSLIEALDTSTAEDGNPGRELFGLRSDGGTFPMRIVARVLPLPHRRLINVTIRDLSGQKRAEATSEAARPTSTQERSVCSTNEVMQPLTAVVSHAQACLRLLQSGMATPEVLADSLQQIAAQGMRAAELLRRSRRS